MKNVLAGGDVAGTKSTVAWAARTGRNVAEIIMTRLNKGGTTNENSLE